MYILFTVPNHSQYTRFGNRETRPCLFSPISPSIIGCFRFLFHLLFAAIHPFLSFVRRVLLYSTCRSFVRQTRSTLQHVSFFRSSDVFFRSTDAFYCTACVVLLLGRRVLSFDRRVLLYCTCRSFVWQMRSFLRLCQYFSRQHQLFVFHH